MLDDVEAGRVLEQPAGEDPAPFGSRISIGPLKHEDLREGPGLRRVFPRGRAFASRQPEHDVADAARLAGFHLDLARDVVALVEQAERRHPVGHWGADAARRLHRRRSLTRQVLGHFGALGLGLGRFARTAGEQQRGCRSREDGSSGQLHPSGVQAS
jgi:hypothetical protein